MKILFGTYYLCWIFLTFLISLIPVPADLGPLLQTLIGVIVLGVYLLVLSSLSWRVIKTMSFRQPRDAVGPAVIVTVLLAFFLISRQMPFFSGVFGGALVTANLLFGATLLGCFLAIAIKRVGELVPVCITAAVADGISVSKGPTKAMIAEITEYYTTGGDGNIPLVDFILIKIALPGYERLVPVFGVTDWIFVALLSAALQRLNLSDNLMPGGLSSSSLLAVPVAGLALYITIIIAQLTGLFLPAMIGIASLFLVFLVVKYDLHRKTRRIDFYYTVIFAGAVAISLLVYATKLA